LPDENLDALNSRVNRTGEQLTEIRFMLPRPRMDVLDALAIFETRTSGEFVSRREICERIIGEYIQSKIDEASLINDVLKNHPTVTEGKQ